MEMIPVDIKKEIEKMIAEINEHNYRYYVLDAPAISDEEYDRLFRQLKELEEKYGYIPADSPTQRVGAPPLEKFNTVKHTDPMLSLGNAFSHDEIHEFDKRVKRFLKSDRDIEYTVEPKYDGLAMELSYKNGMLATASTRGDGFVGEDVTTNVKTIKALPIRIENVSPVPEQIDIRGEVYLDLKEFEKLNKSRLQSEEALFANPRNAAAGSVRQLDSSITAMRNLHMACYGLGAIKGTEFKSQTEYIEWLKKAHFPTPALFRTVTGIEKVIDIVKKIEEERSRFPFETDGAVIKVNDFNLQKQLGSKIREPRWAIAFKFKAHQGTTVIENIVPSVGRTGTITPIAMLTPVKIGGVTVSRSTLHNWDEIERKDIRIGDTVVVERAGDVIPHVVTVITEKRTGQETKFPPPQHCPACGSLVERLEGEAAYRCVGLNCEAQVLEKIRHYASRAAMDIEGLGEKNVELLYSQGLIKHFEDLYRLNEEDLLKLPRFAKKSAQNLVNAIKSSKKTTLARFLYALGIIHVGEATAKLLAQNFEHLNNLYNIKQERIMEIKQMGEKLAESISSFFSKQANLQTLDNLLNKYKIQISNPDYELREQKEKGPLEGLTIVITGTLSKPREEIEAIIEKLGGRVTGSVSRKTDYVLTGKDPGKNKIDSAAQLKVKVIDEHDFMKMTEGT